MEGAPTFSERRLASLYTAADFGGGQTLRAKVIRELIDEIPALRDQVRAVPGIRPRSDQRRPAD